MRDEKVKNLSKKVLSMLLCAGMVLTSMPSAAYATGIEGSVSETVQSETYAADTVSEDVDTQEVNSAAVNDVEENDIPASEESIADTTEQTSNEAETIAPATSTETTIEKDSESQSELVMEAADKDNEMKEVTGEELIEAGISTMADDPTSSDINDFLKSVTMYNSSDQPYNGSDLLNPEGTYRFEIQFAENPDGVQFPPYDPENPTANGMTYQLPEILSIQEIPDTPIYLNGDPTKDQIGTYSISATGLLTVIPNDKPTAWKNTSMFVNFNASFSNAVELSGTQVEIPFVGTGDIVVDFGKIDKLRAEKTAGAVDYSDNSVEFTVKVFADEATKNVVVTDNLGDKLTLVQNSITVTDSANHSVSFGTTAISDDGFTINLGDMGKGDAYTVTYKTQFDLTQASISNSQWQNISEKNDVTITGDGSNDVKKDATASYSYRYFEKIKDGSGVTDNNTKIEWILDVNITTGKDISGWTIKDGLSKDNNPQLTYDTSSPIRVKNVTTGNENYAEISWNDVAFNADRTEWSYVFPESYGSDRYQLIFKTNVPSNDIMGDITFKNNGYLTPSGDNQPTYSDWEPATVSGTFKNKATVEKIPGSIVKDGDNLYIKWTAAITVPAEGLHDVEINDTLSGSHKYVTPLSLITSGNPVYDQVLIEGLPSGVTPTISSENSKFTILFGTDKAHSSLPAQSAAYTINLTYYTQLTSYATGDRSNSLGLIGNGGSVVDTEIKNVVDTDFDKVTVTKKVADDIVEAGTDKYLKWTSTIKVPKAGLHKVKIADRITTDGHEFVTPTELITSGTPDYDQVLIEGLPSGVTPRFSSTWDKGSVKSDYQW